MTIEYVSVGSGAVLDRITLVDGELTYETGKARSMVENRMVRGETPEAIIESLRSWSNGYVLTRESE
jgi:hypothetical protein